MADDPNEIPWLPDEFSNHPLTEEETKEYELAICFERDVLGYPLPIALSIVSSSTFNS